MWVWLLAHEEPVRLAAFLAVLLPMALAEALAPRRPSSQSRAVRWSNNLALVAFNTVLLRLAFPVLAVGAALWALQNGWGLLALQTLPPWLDILLTVLLLDVIIYGQHVLFHRVPALWRLHRMHHADLDFDASTGLRFHPAEIVVSMAIKLAAVVLLGAHPAGVLAFEVLLNATSLFNHGNVRLPAAVDRRLRWLLVTPDMHRVHHSIVRAETDSNFGFSVPWWDRLFRTYRAQPAAGHDGMTIGIPGFREPRELWLDRLMTQPLRAPRP
jgi:sterol desaturase/sphingolipid hydroxylase (fatty acid hydroxylase superfamily)